MAKMKHEKEENENEDDSMLKFEPVQCPKHLKDGVLRYALTL